VYARRLALVTGCRPSSAPTSGRARTRRSRPGSGRTSARPRWRCRCPRPATPSARARECTGRGRSRGRAHGRGGGSARSPRDPVARRGTPEDLRHCQAQLPLQQNLDETADHYREDQNPARFGQAAHIRRDVPRQAQPGPVGPTRHSHTPHTRETRKPCKSQVRGPTPKVRPAACRQGTQAALLRSGLLVITNMEYWACDEDRYRILSKSVCGGRSPVVLGLSENLFR